MNSAAFAKWLARIQLLDSTQRDKALQKLAAAKANGQPRSADHKASKAAPSVAIKAIADAVPEQGLLPNDEQGGAAGVECPHCGDGDIRPWGKASGKPRYRCARCQKTFNALTGTPLAHLRYQERWKDQLQALTDGESLTKAAERCDVAYTTAFRWRHRFLTAVNLGKTSGLSGISEADGAFILESFESKRSDKGRRSSLPGGSPKGKTGRQKRSSAD